MSTFESLGLSADLIEALTAEGIETPTPVQAAALPVIRRGGSVLVEAGPGAGTLFTYGAALLDRIEEPHRHCVLVATAGDDEADALAAALARLAETRSFSVSALGGVWSAPTEASVIFGSAQRLADLLRVSALDLSGVEALVVDRCNDIETRGGLDEVVLLAEALPGVQKVFLGLPISEAVEALARRTAEKPVHVPPRTRPQSGTREASTGTLQYRLVAGRRVRQLLEIVHERLERANRQHVVVHFRTDDLAADIGDALAMHGFTVGSYGDPESRVWLCPPDWEPETVEAERLTVISFEPPVSGARVKVEHEGHNDSIVLLELRELPHLERVAAEARYEVRPLPPRATRGSADGVRRLETRLRREMDQGELTPFLLLAERLGESHDPLHIAAAALSLALSAQPSPVTEPESAGKVLPQTAASWVKLFFSIGSRDEVGPGDLLGAITGETGVSGSQVGRIDIHDSYTVVDVDSAQAERVMKSVNGTTIRGRSVRVDFDRGTAKRPRGGKPGGGRSGSGPPRSGTARGSAS